MCRVVACPVASTTPFPHAPPYILEPYTHFSCHNTLSFIEISLFTRPPLRLLCFSLIRCHPTLPSKQDPPLPSFDADSSRHSCPLDGLRLCFRMSHVATKNNIILEGFLKKKSPKGLVKVWQDRWVRLTDKYLRYYKKRDSVEQGLVAVCTIAKIIYDQQENLKRQRFRFDIQVHERLGGRMFSFIANTEAECVKWVDMLRQAHAAYDEGAYDGEPGALDPSAAWSGRKGKGGASMLAVRDGAYATAYAHYGVPQVLTAPPRRPFMLTETSLCRALFGGFKLLFEEYASEFGSVYVLGNESYSVTRESYLLHAITFDSPNYQTVVDAMSSLPPLSAACPAFPRLLHGGFTSDSVYYIFHPALRVASHSLAAWLDAGLIFPPEAVAFVAAVALSSLEVIHAHGHVYHSLSPETLFIDAEANVRILDPFITIPPSKAPQSLFAYTPPEVAKCGSIAKGRAAGADTARADFWRLGVLLYELATGVPPVRVNKGSVLSLEQQSRMSDEEQDAVLADAVIHQIARFRTADLPFPPSVPAPLRDLIARLLDPSPATRLASASAALAHPFLASARSAAPGGGGSGAGAVQWDAATVTARWPKPEWVRERLVERLSAPDAETPSNLTLVPEPAKIQRVTVVVHEAMGLAPRASERVYVTASLGGDVWKSGVAAKAPLQWGDQHTFCLFGGAQSNGPAELVFEVVSKKLELEGAAPLVGIAALPMDYVRLIGAEEGPAAPGTEGPGMAPPLAVALVDAQGMPAGELVIQLAWDEDAIELNSGVLTPLTPTDKSLAQCFGVPVVSDPHKLWALVVDPSVLDAEDEAATRYSAVASAAATGGGGPPPATATSSSSSSNSGGGGYNSSVMTIRAPNNNPGGGPPPMTPSSMGPMSPNAPPPPFNTPAALGGGVGSGATLRAGSSSSSSAGGVPGSQAGRPSNPLSPAMLASSASFSNMSSAASASPPSMTPSSPRPVPPRPLGPSAAGGLGPAAASPGLGPAASPAPQRRPPPPSQHAGSSSSSTGGVGSMGAHPGGTGRLSSPMTPLPTAPGQGAPVVALQLQQQQLQQQASLQQPRMSASTSGLPLPPAPCAGSLMQQQLLQQGQGQGVGMFRQPQQQDVGAGVGLTRERGGSSAPAPIKARAVPLPPGQQPPPQQGDPNLIGANWRVATNDQGQPYYYNKVTKAVQWAPPQCFVEHAAQKQMNK